MKRRCYHILFWVLLLAGLTAQGQDDVLVVLASQTGPREVTLQWEAAGSATVMRRYADQATPSTLGSTALGTWTDHLGRATCGDTVYYTVSQGALQGAAAISVEDNEPTQPAQWGVVTVEDESQQIVLQWQPSADTDIMGYLICEGTPSMPIDTVYGSGSTQYTFAQGNANQAYLFRICAFDSCQQASALTDGCNNMVLILSGEPCSQTLTATWNPYRHMPGGLDHYELWVSEDGGGWHLAGQTANEEATTLDFTVSEACRKVRGYVKAFSADGSWQANSNHTSLTLGTNERPAYLYLRKVSVADNGTSIHIVGQTDPAFGGSDYKIYRQAEGGGTEVVATVQPSLEGELEWWDMGLQPDEVVYTYWIGVLDLCGRNEVRSGRGSTLRPRIVSQGDDGAVEWAAYEGWEGNTTYQLMVRQLGGETWQLAGSSMETRMEGLASAEARVEYKVIAFEGSNSRWNRMDSLQSAPVAYLPPTVIWMPNAFTPLENNNNRICPQASYINPEDYLFEVYDRQGLLVFSTRLPDAAWDGRHAGKMMPQGAYLYKISYRQNDNTRQERLGTFLLLH